MMTDITNTQEPRAALQFSGGRDSLALLLAMKPMWDTLTVYYLNSGDAYPETLALVDKVRQVVPYFVEVQGRSPQTIERYGWPSDVLHPGAMWPAGKLQIADHQPLNDKFFCCFNSIMAPLHERMVADGVTVILRGQRDSDNPKSHVKNGETVDGFTILYPIAEWDVDAVEQYIIQSGWEVPPYYAYGLTSAPDCMHCTAWLEHRALNYLNVHYPETGATVRRRLVRIHDLVKPALTTLESAIYYGPAIGLGKTEVDHGS